MAPALFLLSIHVLMALFLAALLLWPRLPRRWAGSSAGSRAFDFGLAVLVGNLALLLKAGHGWPDMPTKIVGALLGLAALWLLASSGRRPRMAAACRCFLAGFWLVLGVQSLRNAVPLPATPALGALLLAALLLVRPLPAANARVGAQAEAQAGSPPRRLIRALAFALLLGAAFTLVSAP